MTRPTSSISRFKSSTKTDVKLPLGAGSVSNEYSSDDRAEGRWISDRLRCLSGIAYTSLPYEQEMVNRVGLGLDNQLVYAPASSKRTRDVKARVARMERRSDACACADLSAKSGDEAASGLPDFASRPTANRAAEAHQPGHSLTSLRSPRRGVSKNEH
jgi:hypothetical protein